MNPINYLGKAKEYWIVLVIFILIFLAGVPLNLLMDSTPGLIPNQTKVLEPGEEYFINPMDIVNENSTYQIASDDTWGESNIQIWYDLGADEIIPENSNIDGVKIELESLEYRDGGSGGIYDIWLSYQDEEIGSRKYFDVNTSEYKLESLGGESDTWGANLTYDVIVDESFGFAIDGNEVYDEGTKLRLARVYVYYSYNNETEQNETDTTEDDDSSFSGSVVINNYYEVYMNESELKENLDMDFWTWLETFFKDFFETIKKGMNIN